MTSPGSTPAASAGPPEVTDWTSAPDGLAHGVRRHGEADADVALGGARGGDLRVDADHAPGLVEQRPARVAGVDRGVGLDDLVDREAVGRLDLAPDAGHDALGRRAVQAERVADGDGGVAHLDLARIGELQRLDAARLAARVDVHDREVARRVGALDLAVEAAPVGAELDDDAVGAAADVRIGHERAVAVDEEAGARAD